MGKATSGGGINSNKFVRSPVSAGPPRTNVVSPGAVSQIGVRQVTSTGKPDPLITRTAPQVPLGNAVALNVGKGGPGVGRDVHRSGTQSPTPPAIPMPLGEWGLDPKKG